MVGKDFVNGTQKAITLKENNWWIVLGKIKNFLLSKDTIKIVKIQTRVGGDICYIYFQKSTHIKYK